LPELGAEFNPSVRELVKLVVTVEFSQMYSQAEVENARKLLVKNYGRVPTLDELGLKIGTDSITALAKEELSRRKIEIEDVMERMGIGSRCHLCGGERADEDPHYEFSLAKNLKKKWGGTLAKLAINVVTVPLGVVVAPRGPGLSADLARCRLVMCSSCGEQHKGVFGAINATKGECEKHPSWNRLVAAGFDRYFDKVETAKFS